MADDAILNAIRRRADLESKILKAEEAMRRYRGQIQEISKFIKQWEKFSGRSAEQISQSNSLKIKEDFRSPESTLDSMGTLNPKKEIVAQKVVDILKSRTDPVSRSDLYKELLKQGLSFSGANPEMILSTMLWRTRDSYNIRRLSTGGYTLDSKVEDGNEIFDDIMDEDDII